MASRQIGIRHPTRPQLHPNCCLLQVEHRSGVPGLPRDIVLTPVSGCHHNMDLAKGRIVGNDGFADLNGLIESTSRIVGHHLRNAHDRRKGIELIRTDGFISRFLRSSDARETQRQPLMCRGVTGIKGNGFFVFGLLMAVDLRRGLRGI